MTSEKAKEYLRTSSIGDTISNLHDVFRVNNNDLDVVIDDVCTIAEIAFDDGVESEKKKVEWHNLKENPNDLPPAQDYEIKESIDYWKWYLVKTDYTNYKSCQYAICARVLMPRYSDGIDEPIWKENSGNDIGDEHIFEWREL